MILTEADYNEMWTKDFAMPIHTIPSYHQYLQREVYQQDYLDLFLGKPTFERERDGNQFGVPIKIFRAKGIIVNPCSPYVEKINDKECLLVDYGYPFPDEELEKERSIKYVLIGEAAPPLKAPINENTYFYNKQHKGTTPYFDAPCKAFGIACKKKHKSKKDKILVELANKGVVLFDLFPFSIIYDNKIRSLLAACAINQFSLIKKEIVKLSCKKGKVKYSFLCSTLNALDIIKVPIFGVHEMSDTVIRTTTVWQDWLSRQIPGITGAPLLALKGDWHGVVADIKLGADKVSKGDKRIHKYRSIGKVMYPQCPPHKIPIRFSFDL